MTNYALYSNSMGSGKTYFADWLVNEGYTKLSFADGLKTNVHNFLDYKEIQYNPLEKDVPLSDGRTLREWYIDSAKVIQDNMGGAVFTDALVNKVKSNPSIPYVVDDVRTPQEYTALKDLGFKFIFVDRLLDTPNNEMEGLLFTNVIHHLNTTDSFILPNYLQGNTKFSEYALNVLMGRKEVEYEALKKVLLKGFEVLQSTINPTKPYTITISFKNTKARDRQVYVDYSGLVEGEGRFFKLHTFKDVAIVAWYIKELIQENSLVVDDPHDHDLDSVLELIQMDDDEELYE
jgi:hypothetical protein